MTLLPHPFYLLDWNRRHSRINTPTPTAPQPVLQQHTDCIHEMMTSSCWLRYPGQHTLGGMHPRRRKLPPSLLQTPCAVLSKGLGTTKGLTTVSKTARAQRLRNGLILSQGVHPPEHSPTWSRQAESPRFPLHWLVLKQVPAAAPQLSTEALKLPCCALRPISSSQYALR